MKGKQIVTKDDVQSVEAQYADLFKDLEKVCERDELELIKSYAVMNGMDTSILDAQKKRIKKAMKEFFATTAGKDVLKSREIIKKVQRNRAVMSGKIEGVFEMIMRKNRNSVSAKQLLSAASQELLGGSDGDGE